MGFLDAPLDWLTYDYDVYVSGNRNKALSDYAKITNEGAGDIVAGPQDTTPLVTQTDVNNVAPPGSDFKPYSQNFNDALNKWIADNQGTLIAIGVSVGIILTISILVQIAPIIALVKK